MENLEAAKTAQDIKKMIEDGDIKLPEGEEFDSSVYDEFLEAHKAKEKKILESYAAEIRQDMPEAAAIPEEKIELVLKEIIEKDGLEDEETANEFFEMMWKKIKSQAVKDRDFHDITTPRAPEFVDLEGKNSKDPISELVNDAMKDTFSDSVSANELLYGKDTFEKI